MKTVNAWLFALLAVASAQTALHAQGVVVSGNDRQGLRDFFAIARQEVRVTIRDQYAEVTVDQWIKNVSQENAEAVWMFPVPDGADVGAVEMYLGEQKMTGTMLPAKEARDVYNDIVRRKRDPALLEFVGRGVYRTSVFPFRRDEVKQLKMKYALLLRDAGGLVRFLHPLGNARFSCYPVERTRVVVDIVSSRPIRNVYSPSHDIGVSRATDRRVQCLWESEKVETHHDIEIYYSLENGGGGANVMTYRAEGRDDGYFLFLASPRTDVKEEEIARKDVVFVVDRSGSMAADRKLDQARAAILHCVDRLRSRDRFDIVAFGNGVDSCFRALRPADDETRATAKMFLNGLAPAGGTNISDALERAYGVLDGTGNSRFVLFVTDGLPTVGLMDLREIVARMERLKRSDVRLFTFGVGYDVNAVLLDRLAREHRGLSDYIDPGQSIKDKIAGFFARVGDPVMSDLALTASGIQLFDVYPLRIPDLFAGDQVVICGRYRGEGTVRFSLEGKTPSGTRTFQWEGTVTGRSGNDPSRFFVERLWASKQIGFLLDQVRFGGVKKELTDEIVRLSVKYGIITEYTSFLIREDLQIRNPTAHVLRTEEELKRRLAVQSGLHGVAQSRNGAKMQEGNNANQNDWYFDEQGKRVDVARVQTVGGKTFIQDRGVWNDTTVPVDARGTEVKYFSEEFFRLLADHPEMNQYVAAGGAMDIRLRDKVYSMR